MLATAADVRAAIPNGADLPASVVDDLLAAADAAAKTYMGRTIELATFRERIPAGEYGIRMFVKEYPVVSITSVNTAESAAMDVWNGTYQRATVVVTDAAVKLRHFNNLAWVDNTLAFADYPTLTTLAAAIAALPGWDAELSGEVLGTEPSDELAELNGPIGVGDSKPKTLYLLDGEPETDFKLESGSFTFLSPGHKVGESVLVRYTAGYATVPADVTQGVAMLAAEMYALTQASSGMKSEKLGDYSYERFEFGSSVLTPTVKGLLGAWRRLA